MKLLSDASLERSGVVANCCMNRERSLTGSNGYARELGFHPLDVLRARAAMTRNVAWLDLCCGSGKALLEAAEIIRSEELEDRIAIVGVDLVATWPSSPGPACLEFVQASLADWKPERQFELISCVHGLHYLGDKLALIARAAAWLTDQGRFAASLDLENFKFQDGSPAGRAIVSELRRLGWQYNSRKKLLICDGRRDIALPFEYLGADDQAGPNYTGQAAVDSYYRRR